MEAARQLLLDYFPGCDPAWFGGEAHGERRLDVFLVGSASEDQVYCVASLCIDGCFVPDVVSEYPHVPYDTAWVNAKPPRGAETGVFASVTQVQSPDATAVRFTHRGQARTAPVIGGWCALFDWDTMWLLGANTPKPEALHIGGRWVPTVSSLAAATPEAFCAAYGAFYDTEGPRGTAPDWAVMSFFEDGTFAEKLHMVEWPAGRRPVPPRARVRGRGACRGPDRPRAAGLRDTRCGHAGTLAPAAVRHVLEFGAIGYPGAVAGVADAARVRGHAAVRPADLVLVARRAGDRVQEARRSALRPLWAPCSESGRYRTNGDTVVECCLDVEVSLRPNSDIRTGYLHRIFAQAKRLDRKRPVARCENLKLCTVEQWARSMRIAPECRLRFQTVACDIRIPIIDEGGQTRPMDRITVFLGHSNKRIKSLTEKGVE